MIAVDAHATEGGSADHALVRARARIRELAEALVPDELFARALDVVAEASGSRIAFCHFVEDGGQALRLQAWSTRTSSEFCTAGGKGSHYPLASAGVWADCLREKRAVVHNDYASLPHRKGLPAGHAPVVRELVVPVLRSGRIVAVLGVGNKSTPYQDLDVAITAALADTVFDEVGRKTLEAALRASEATFREFMHHLPGLALIKDADGRVVFANRGVAQLLGLGLADVHGRRTADLFPEAIAARAAADDLRVLEGGKAETLEETFGERVWQTTRFPIDREGAAPLLGAISLDVTSWRALELNRQQEQKLLAVGQLAGGIAHEINTPAQFVSDSLQFLGEAVEDLLRAIARISEVSASGSDAAQLARAIDEIVREADLAYLREHLPRASVAAREGLGRIIHIVQAMKELAYPSSSDKSLADLSKIVENTLTIARNEYKYVADLHCELGDLPLVRCSVGDLGQVLLSLVVNAAHAVADAVGDTGARGSITLCTRHVGPWVEISVTDTGTGIPPELRPRVFEPFFTTKPVGRGSGQGLAIAHAIVVNKHHGELTFTTEVGRGTTFVVRLPIDGRQP